MEANFKVTPSELMEASRVLGTVSADFLKEVENMYNALEELMAKWQGEGSGEYYQGALNYKNDIKNLGIVIGQYSDFLFKASASYRNTDDSVAGAAGGMFGGRG